MVESLNLAASIITLANAAYWSYRFRNRIIGRVRDSWLADMLLVLQMAYYIDAA